MEKTIEVLKQEYIKPVYKYTKESVLILKEAIRVLAETQKALRPQKKDAFAGIRTTDYPSYDHHNNRIKLRYMYLAYGIMRNKTIEKMEATKAKNYQKHSQYLLDKAIKEYGMEIIYTNKE